MLEDRGYAPPYDGEETPEEVRLRKQQEWHRTLSPDEHAAWVAAAQAAKARLLELRRLEKEAVRDKAYELFAIEEAKWHEAYGASCAAQFAFELGVVDSPQQARQMIAMVRELQKWPLLRAAFDSGKVDHWTKLRDCVREAARRGRPEDEAGILEDLLELNSREIERKYRRLRGEPDTVDLRFEASLATAGSWWQAMTALREADPEITDEAALGMAARALLHGLGEAAVSGEDEAAGKPVMRRETRLVLHLAVPASHERAPDASNAQAALDAASAAVAAVIETRDGPEPVPQDLLDLELCCAEIDDARVEPSRLTRTVPPATERYVFDRDRRRCRNPRCKNLGWLHVHHEPGRRLVGHDPSKMFLLCGPCHRMVHQGRLRPDLLPGGLLRFTYADGSTECVPLDAPIMVEAPLPIAQAAALAPKTPRQVENAVEERGAPAPKWREAQAWVQRAVTSLSALSGEIDARSLLRQALRAVPRFAAGVRGASGP